MTTVHVWFDAEGSAWIVSDSEGHKTYSTHTDAKQAWKAGCKLAYVLQVECHEVDKYGETVGIYDPAVSQ